MRSRVARLFGVASLSLFFALSLPGCSGQQQGEEGLEVSQGNESEEGNNVAEDGENANATVNEGEAEGENGAENGGENAIEDLNTEGAGEEGAANATENDLQEIISEMNGQQQQGDAMADMGAEAPAPAPAADAMAAAPMNAVPANPAPAAPAAPADPAAAPSSALPFQPGGSPAGQGLPELGSKMAYIVQAGDTLGKISTKVYGSPNRWNEMANLSGLTNPSRIYPGDVVYYTLDESAVAFATAYETVQRSEATVQPGDTLATIAQRVYGNPKAWKSIWRQNDKIDNPDIVAPGTTVYYIAKGSLSAAIKKARVQLSQTVNSKKTETNHITAQTNNDSMNLIANVSTDNNLELAEGHVAYNAAVNSLYINNNNVALN